MNLSTRILNQFSDRIEIHFIVDDFYGKKLANHDEKFNIHTFAYEKEDKLRANYMIDTLEACLSMSLIDKQALFWKMMLEDDLLIEGDRKTEEIIKNLNLDFLLCDQNFHLPAILLSNLPYAFINTYNPCFFAINGLAMGSDAGANEIKKNKQFNQEFEVHKIEIKQKIFEILKKRNAKFKREDIEIDQILSDHFSLYAYSQEIDYFSEETRNQFKLWQIDTALFKEKIPKPYDLPEEFKRLPGKIVYVSLGSLFSSYTYIMQKLIMILDIFDNLKFIVSKGLNGDQLVLPKAKFIGENYVNQLGVLQVVDAAILHDGNNSVNECFYFEVPCIILPIIVDQINNGKRIEELNYGYQIKDILNYEEQELIDKLTKLINDEELKLKWKRASERIQQEDRISKIVQKIVDYVCEL